MDFKDSKSLKEFDNDVLYDVLCKSLSHPDDILHLKELYKDTTTLHYHLFDDPIFTEKRNKTEDNPFKPRKLFFQIHIFRSKFIRNQ